MTFHKSLAIENDSLLDSFFDRFCGLCPIFLEEKILIYWKNFSTLSHIDLFRPFPNTPWVWTIFLSFLPSAHLGTFILITFRFSGCPRGVMVEAMNCGIVVREFVLQSRYYVHFRANTLGKGMNPLILPPAMGK